MCIDYLTNDILLFAFNIYGFITTILLFRLSSLFVRNALDYANLRFEHMLHKDIGRMDCSLRDE